MNTLLRTLTALLVFTAAMPVFAAVSDTELKVERRTLDRQKTLNHPRQNREELTRGLRITVKNSSGKPLPAGEVEWAILVERAGAKRTIISTGKETLKPLAVSQVVLFDVGAVPVMDFGVARQEMEYRVIIRRGGEEVTRVVSTQSFDQQAKAAHPLEKPDKKEKPASKDEK